MKLKVSLTFTVVLLAIIATGVLGPYYVGQIVNLYVLNEIILLSDGFYSFALWFLGCIVTGLFGWIVVALYFTFFNQPKP